MPFVQTTFLIFLRHSGGHTFPKLLRATQGAAKDLLSKTLNTFTALPMLTRIFGDLQEYLSTDISVLS